MTNIKYMFDSIHFNVDTKYSSLTISVEWTLAPLLMREKTSDNDPVSQAMNSCCDCCKKHIGKQTVHQLSTC